jgi:glycosyltransferase involved in cell wall biosynthesis
MVCVIVVTHNIDTVLESALRSLINSELVDEIVIVDNNSSDNTRLIIDNFVHKYPGLIKKKN